MPGWDGIRGLAVGAVLLYHMGWRPLRGGFLGVSAFFTLSGFLIASQLYDEVARAKTVDLRAFWARRARRLGPPIVACLVLVEAFARVAATPAQQAHLRLDSLATLTEWANWRFLFTGQNYGGGLVSPSPFLHAWSLSIEEQCYILLPLIVIIGWRVAKWRGVTVGLSTVLLASIVAGALTTNPQAAYYGTHVRAAELLIGALGALVLRTKAAPAVTRFCVAFSPFALIALVWSWTQASETSAVLPRGGFAAHALAVLAVIVAAREACITARLLRFRPLVWLGRISYGVYLYHWPIFLWLTPRRVGMDPLPTNLIRLACTLLVAVVSYRLLERPVVQLRTPPVRTLLGAGVALSLALTVALVVTPIPSNGSQIAFGQTLEAPPNQLHTPPASSAQLPSTTTTLASASPTVAGVAFTPPAPETHVRPSLPEPLPAATPGTEPPRVMVVGDSEATTIGDGLQRIGAQTGTARVWVAGWLGCPITLGGAYRWNGGVIARIPDRCNWTTGRSSDLRLVQPDVVVISSGLWEITDRQFDGAADWVHIGEPAMDLRIEQSLAAFTDLERSRGARVVWLLQAPFKNSIYAQVPGPLPEENPARVERLNQLISAVAASRDGVWTIDVPSVLQDRYGDPYALANRTDGIHWTNAGADMDASWMLPLVVDIDHAPMARAAPLRAPNGAN